VERGEGERGKKRRREKKAVRAPVKTTKWLL